MAEKKIFKIWDRKHGNYVTGNKSKSSWSSLSWVTSKIEDEMRFGYGYNNQPKRNPDEFEVREFKLVLENTMDGGDLFREKKEIERIRKEGARVYGVAADKVKEIIPNLKVSDIRSMYKDGFFADDVNTMLEPYIQVMADNYRYTQK